MDGGALSDYNWLVELIGWTDCNHQLEIRCINITQITPGVLQLASLTVGEG